MRVFQYLAFLSGTVLACAQPPSFLPEDAAYDPAITPPAAYLGYRIGERHLRHAELVGYLRQLAAESDRVAVLEYGRTHDHRPLLQLLISSPENIRKAETIRVGQLRLTDPGQSGRLDLGEMPVVVNLNYGVHGNEASASNAAPVVAYHLAAGTGPDMEELLENTVILLDPALNPDGMDRFAEWVNSRVGKNPNADPQTAEHREPWPNGRTNYYWFDLNRDWMLLTQPESRGRLELYHDWMPGFVLDFHEMGTDRTYFFQPGVPERNHPLTPESVFELTEAVSRSFSEALDDTGSLYFSKERFDDFYMGKGSTMPDLKGAVGVLFEQGSARGHVQDSIHGPVTFPFAIRNQVTVSLSVLEAARDHRIDFLEHTREFFQTSLEAGRKAGIAGYRFASPEDPRRAREFADVLKTHRIEVTPLKDGAGWFVPARQPHYLYLQALIEQRTEFEEDIFYDITAWTLPLAYHLDWEEVDRKPDSGGHPDESPDLAESGLGYLIDWNALYAPRLLLDLMEADVMAKAAMRPFTLEGRPHDAGTVFIPVSLQREKAETIHRILQTGMQDWEVPVTPVTTFLTEEGIDLGSDQIVPLKEARIVLVVGDGVSPYSAGSLWHLLDVRQDYPVTLVSMRQLQDMPLHEYTAILLPHSWGNGLSQSLGEQLSDFVRGGGTLACFGRAAAWAAGLDWVELKLMEKEVPADSKDSGEAEPPSSERRSFANAADDNALQQIRGAIFKAEADLTHPLLFGYTRESLPVFVSGTRFLAPSPNRYQTPLAFPEDPLLAGYASHENLQAISGAAAATVHTHGAGAVVLFGIDPVFRAYWRGTEKLVLNALLFGPHMQARDPGGY